LHGSTPNAVELAGVYGEKGIGARKPSRA